ncbi:MAG: arginine--tRNA ligase [Bdellovibrionaceae bacterium]|nr:arginine--tRNA ligase [Pseudobdellovibrionaceae bacterium]
MEKHQDTFLTQVVERATSAAQVVAQTLAGQPEVRSEEIAALVTTPPEFKFGQAALPCHSFARKFRLAPVKIAEEMAKQINEWAQASGANAHIARVEAVNGYLNFHCNFKNYGQHLLADIHSGEYFQRPLLEPARREKILLEYAQPNTHKALHVGHLRNMVFGDSVARILEYAGHEVVRATYPGDMGAHIAKSIWFIQTRLGGKLPTERQADWLGEVYAQSDDYVKSITDLGEQAKIKAEIGSVLKDLHSHQGPTYELYKTTREWSLAQQKRIYAWLGMTFDIWYFESECDEPSRDLVLKKFEEGFFQKSEGAIGLDLSQWNLGFAMFLKSDGNGLYLTKDLELIRRKFADPKVARSIVVVDARQRLHFQQLFKTAELMGYPQAAKSVHLSYESVTTADGVPCSSRNLNGILLEDLRKVIEDKVILDHLHAYHGQWSEAEIRQVAEKVTLGALKYGFLRVDGNSVIKFMLDEWLKLEGDTGPYLQYVHARCKSLLEKVERADGGREVVFETPFEEELLVHLGRFNQVALQAADGYRPAVISAYLHELCRLYNRFYKECPVKTAEGALRNSRLALVEASSAVLRTGLELLGIPAPDRM